MTTPPYDRARHDVGNVIALEHVNVAVPDVELAVLFHVHGLGLTRDPYLDLGPDLLWINVGAQQFHLPVGEAQVLRGTIELVLPGLDGLRRRLDKLAPRFAGTRFEVHDIGGHVDVRGPWGNRFRCREPEPGERMRLGMPTLELPVPPGTAGGIARFYRDVIGATATTVDGWCEVGVGPGQALRFVETSDEVATYDGHHIAVYVANFSGPHRWLVERGLIIEESDDHQYRFSAIVDPETGERLWDLEHEIRSLSHPLRGRPLVNRNPDQRIPTYVPGGDPYHPNAGEPTWAEHRAALGTVG